MSQDMMRKTEVPADADMVKTITMGVYFKYDENSPWFSLSGTPGTVRVLEGHLVYAVRDIEVFDTPRHDPCMRQEQSSRRVIRWEVVTTPMIQAVRQKDLDST